MNPNKVIRTKRSVIEHKLLTMNPIYNIQLFTEHGWQTGFLGSLPCTLIDLLTELAQAMPDRKLRVYMAGEVTRVAVY